MTPCWKICVFADGVSTYPPSEANSLEIYIVPKGDKYVVTEFAKGEFKLDYLAKRCESKKDISMPLLVREKYLHYVPRNLDSQNSCIHKTALMNAIRDKWPEG